MIYHFGTAGKRLLYRFSDFATTGVVTPVTKLLFTDLAGQPVTVSGAQQKG
jgi:hypothetical protein